MSTPTMTEAAAGHDWESRWASAEAAIDPAYERANAALRRWVDGMEQALLAGAASRRAGLTRGGSRAGLPALPARLPRHELASS
jgi:hypothetical protein